MEMTLIYARIADRVVAGLVEAVLGQVGRQQRGGVVCYMRVIQRQ